MILREIIDLEESNQDIYHLACISKQLREFVFNMPRFWSRIIFVAPSDMDAIDSRRAPPNFSRTVWFLTHAPKRLRSTMIDIEISDTQASFGYDDILNILNILCRSRRGKTGRWRSLTIDVASVDILQYFFSHISRPPPTESSRLRHHAIPRPASHKTLPLKLQTLELGCQDKSRIHPSLRILPN
jgi:hypothetical protein